MDNNNFSNLPILMGIPPDLPQEQSPFDSLHHLVPPPSTAFLAPHQPFFNRNRRRLLPSLRRLWQSYKPCRRAVMERRYSLDQEEVCQICERRPFHNWVDHCVEDVGDYALPIDPFVSPVFTPWMQKYIEERLYTPQQYDTLRQQKINVLQTAAHQQSMELALLTPSLLDIVHGVATSSDPDDEDSEQRIMWDPFSQTSLLTTNLSEKTPQTQSSRHYCRFHVATKPVSTAS
ncbi:hypothetical protein BDV59DRAFT_180351 [Aspergillus ambiguus]|uniref:uncharacterized protein n=1 Tax=Aspergillus ambiguus TaxID=176160 RepID=UPI003CCE5104